jgi:hypothetical protein|tara:strand:- start:347 stop:637 length:291 start_codon:yes stop_codon:yes gene_type:complete
VNKAEKEHLRKVAELGCIACRKNGFYDTPAEIHHISNGIIGKRASHFETIPLCHYHHRTSNEAYHNDPKGFTIKYGTQKELLEETMDLIYVKDQNK